MNKPSTLALVVIFLLVPLGPLAIDVFLPSMPDMAMYFGATDPEIQLMIPVYVLALGVSQLLAGPMSDKYGRKASIVTGLITYAIASLLVAFASDVMYVYGLRVMQGVGASFTMVSAMAWIRDHYDGAVAAKWMSYIGGVTSAIPTIAPALGSVLALYLGWAGGFYAMAFAAFLILVLAIKAIPSERSVVLTTDTKDSEQLSCNLRDILSNAQFRVYALANMLSFGALLSYVAISPVFAMQEAGLDPFAFSLLFGAIGVMQVLASVLAPKFIHHQGRRKTVLVGLGVIVFGGFGLIQVSEQNVVGFFVFAAMGCGGFSLLSGASTSLSLESFKYCAGLATSIDGFLRMVGGAVIAAVVSLLPVASTNKLAVALWLTVLPLLLVYWQKGNR